MEKKINKAWEPVKDWYDELVGKEGHYYHQAVIIPEILKQIKKINPASVLDLACGQGVLSRHLDKDVEYRGVDLSPSLIKSAITQNRKKKHRFFVSDVCDIQCDLKIERFDLATLILAIQDIDNLEGVLKTASNRLKPAGKLLIVMTHPCFRIPRQSSWDYDEKSNILNRTMRLYLSETAIPIQTHPGKKGRSPVVKHHHRPLKTYFQTLAKAGFCVDDLDEWTSNKKSTGKRAKAENRARGEFPLFLSLRAVKVQA